MVSPFELHVHFNRYTSSRLIDPRAVRLRWTSTQEWHDIYQKENLDDLQKFFDHFMKGKENGWQTTPAVRLSLLGYNRPSVVNRAEPSYPPPDFKYTTLFLDAKTSSLQAHPVLGPSTTSYQADSSSDNGVYFDLKFESYTELCGISRVKLFMSAVEHNDMVDYPAAVLKTLANINRRTSTSFCEN
jgi:uncharacterized protein